MKNFKISTVSQFGEKKSQNEIWKKLFEECLKKVYK